jgi:uncharacterized membrane protein YfhO
MSVKRTTGLVAWKPTQQVSSRAHLEDSRPARIVQDTGERVTVDLPRGAFGRLILADAYYPGWTATVDGRPAPVERYSGYLRAVAIPRGARSVVFEYRPWWLVPGAATSVGALLLTLALAVWPLVAARRRARSRLA